jgi:predicted transcriptional regulator
MGASPLPPRPRPCPARLLSVEQRVASQVLAATALIDGMTRVILHAMKTAVSIPDPIYRRAEKAARQLGVSRSRLYSTAIAEYLQRHTDDQIVEQLNAIHGALQETLDPVLAEAQSRSLPQERW